jgi:Trm5-related predicted tRNA methylase
VMDGTFYYHSKEQIISLHLGLLESGNLESVIPTNPQFIYSKHNECIQFDKKKEELQTTIKITSAYVRTYLLNL